MNRQVRQQRAICGLLSTGSRLLFVTLVVCGDHMLAAKGETKEFDWSELGVSLAGSPAKPSYQGVPNNLRILVSPQKRITKNYEFDYSNNSQPIGETSYMVPSGSYVTGSHSAAYSALSASLASLKNRLNSRGSSLSDSGSQSGPYSAGYATSMLGDTQRISQVPQPTYLSVSNHPEFNPSSYVNGQNNQSTDNKTIVLAIPAKINFLTEKQQQQQQIQLQPQQQQQQQQQQQLQLQPQQQQQQQQQQLPQQQPQIQLQAQPQVQQPQQVTVIQAAPQEQQIRPDYSKQLGYSHGQDGVVGDQSIRDPSQDHEHQYVIVNSATSHVSPDGSQHGQLMATQLTAAAPQQIQAQQVPQTIYSSIYPSGSIAMKYIPATTYQQAQSVAQMQQSAGQPQHQHPVVAAYEQQLTAMEPTAYNSQSSSSCPDTCNSADIRWRKYTVSKYKSCCSRSSQYDLAQFEHPSMEKLGESSKQADDAYYNYLYRKSRSSRRSRKSRGHPTSRYYRYSGSAALGAASSNNPNNGQEDITDHSQGGDAPISGRYTSPSSQRHHSSYYPQEPSPYMKYYPKSRQVVSHEPQEAAHEPSTPTGTGRRGSKSYRRGRSRDFDAQSAISSQDSYDSSADEDEQQSSSFGSASRGSSSPSSGYGSGDFSIDASGRYPQETRNSNNEEEERGVSYDDQQEGEQAGKGAISSSSELVEDGTIGQENEGAATSIGDEAPYEPELTSHTSNKYSNKRRNKKVSDRSRVSLPRKNGKAGRGRGRGKGKVSKQEYSSSQKNSTSVYADFDSVSTSDEQNKQPEYNSNSTSSAGNEGEEPQAQQKDSYSSFGTSDSSSADMEKDSLSPPSNSNKHKSNLNETTVANLSKTTMHLKEILTMLEKKAQMRANETSLTSLTTSTPLPITTTTYYPASLFSSSFSGPTLSGVLSSADYLASSDLTQLKSSYRDNPSISSSLTLPTAYNSLASDVLSSPYTSYNPAPYSMSVAAKHYPHGSTRKRRVPKTVRYNHLMLQKHHGLGSSYQLSHPATSKSPFLNSAYLQSLQYPYWPYRPNSPSATNSYPYKSTHKNTYSSLMNVGASSQTKSPGQLYSDESRYHGLTYADPLTSVASSLRPPSTMRLRPKQFMFQPHTLPMYARHSLFSQPLDVKK